jgi:hypothetical protein
MTEFPNAFARIGIASLVTAAKELIKPNLIMDVAAMAPITTAQKMKRG